MLMPTHSVLRSGPVSEPLVMEIDTTASTGNDFILPLGGTVNATVDWGDGTQDTYTSPGNRTHTYAAPGQYTVTISGTVTEWSYTMADLTSAQIDSQNKIQAITSFGNIGIVNLGGMFRYTTNAGVPDSLPSTVTSLRSCFSNATVSANLNSWDVSGVVILTSMFRDTQMNGDISGWNVSNAIAANSMFLNSQFNGDISNWDVSGVANMIQAFANSTFDQDLGWMVLLPVVNLVAMLNNSGLSPENYARTLIGWANNIHSRGGVVTGRSLGAAGLQYDPQEFGDITGQFNDARSARDYLTGTLGWMITDAGAIDELVLEIDTTRSLGTTMILSCPGPTASYIVDWGDGNISGTQIAGSLAHTYSAEGTYTITIKGHIPTWGSGSFLALTPTTGIIRSQQKIKKVVQFPRTGLTNMSGALTHTLSDLEVPPTFGAEMAPTDLRFMFVNSGFQGDISGWDVSTVTDFSFMFANSQFNQPLAAWDMSGATNTTQMFSGSQYNSNIDGWNLSNCNSFFRMFWNSQFNQPLNGWTLRSTGAANISLQEMFRQTPFNQDLNNWNTSLVTNMSGMFQNGGFNGNISNWDVSNVTNFSNFLIACPFNQNLDNWNTGNATTMAAMFWLTQMTGGLENWDVSKVTNMSSMFQQTPFNGDISGWDVGACTNFAQMFRATTHFNRDLTGWVPSSAQIGIFAMFHSAQVFNQPMNWLDVSNAMDVREVFFNAPQYNQPVDQWVLRTDVVSPNLFSNSGLNAENYARTLIGWANNIHDRGGVVTGRSLGANNIQYSTATYGDITGQFNNAVDARDYLINTLNWSITDAGAAP